MISSFASMQQRLGIEGHSAVSLHSVVLSVAGVLEDTIGAGNSAFSESVMRA